MARNAEDRNKKKRVKKQKKNKKQKNVSGRLRGIEKSWRRVGPPLLCPRRGLPIVKVTARERHKKKRKEKKRKEKKRENPTVRSPSLTLHSDGVSKCESFSVVFVGLLVFLNKWPEKIEGIGSKIDQKFKFKLRRHK